MLAFCIMLRKTMNEYFELKMILRLRDCYLFSMFMIKLFEIHDQL